MSDFVTQHAVMVNGTIYCAPSSPWIPARPAVFDSKLAALDAAATLEQHLRETTGLTPIITIAHRYCSAWTTQDVCAGIVADFEAILDDDRGDCGA
ncbi:hypothetical protein ACPXB3_21870 [Gordonia sp. DT219]|uniref:hypothetical protein n=1 Tax=Gordonia sp. DT219 TaxID=3416658 RepID=UPI003CEEFA64